MCDWTNCRDIYYAHVTGAYKGKTSITCQIFKVEINFHLINSIYFLKCILYCCENDWWVYSYELRQETEQINKWEREHDSSTYIYNLENFN